MVFVGTDNKRPAPMYELALLCRAPRIVARSRATIRGDGKNTITLQDFEAWDRLARLIAEAVKADKILKIIAAVRHRLVIDYGSLFAAWRDHFDVDHNGTVSMSEFWDACRKLGLAFGGNAIYLHRHKDSKGSALPADPNNQRNQKMSKNQKM